MKSFSMWPKRPKLPQESKAQQLSSFPILPELSQNRETQAPPTQRTEPQIIEDCYIDDVKLLKICEQRFGLGNYKLRFKFNRYYLSAPEVLDEDTLRQCEIRYL